ncbi:hypothetical protein CEE37_14065 [candidate division LCP-89 bacterium B3_LCP]|uniref:Secretion system C-terminal sorting domain-containing protein n=1 Tax=candidate division LCP-89 bacterium B3_LCP TaxID=2012998 RepID=A0A532UQL5_UNCL8|nr:MAG: hypothetical protein CEE37_14065 [candidate division LCP-89 bacterium B3_LCP]
MFIYDCNPVVSHNTIVQNRCTSASSVGGGIYVNSGGSYSGVNNIIYYNEAAYGEQWYGEPLLDYSCCSQELAGTGNIVADPLLADPAGFDFNLRWGSPCIDAGDPLSPPDPDSTRADMGALYYHQYTATENVPGITNPGEFTLYPAYPNPFNPTTTISYQLSTNSPVYLSVYDVSGRQVAELVNGYREAGAHEVTFNGSELASGIYIYHLTSGGFTESGKMVLVK